MGKQVSAGGGAGRLAPRKAHDQDWAAHYLLPVGCHWLGDAQLSKIQTVLFGSGMGAVVAGVVRNQINKAS